MDGTLAGASMVDFVGAVYRKRVGKRGVLLNQIAIVHRQRGRQQAMAAVVAAWMAANEAAGRPPSLGRPLLPLPAEGPYTGPHDPPPKLDRQALVQAERTIQLAAFEYKLSPDAVLADPDLLYEAVLQEMEADRKAHEQQQQQEQQRYDGARRLREAAQEEADAPAAARRRL